VELLVADAAWHQQVRVVLAGGQAGAQLVGVLAEPVEVRGDDAARRRDHGTPPGEGGEDRLVG